MSEVWQMTQPPRDADRELREVAKEWAARESFHQSVPEKGYSAAFKAGAQWERARLKEQMTELVEAAEDWLRETEEECGHNPEWQVLAERIEAWKACK